MLQHYALSVFDKLRTEKLLLLWSMGRIWERLERARGWLFNNTQALMIKWVTFCSKFWDKFDVSFSLTDIPWEEIDQILGKSEPRYFFFFLINSSFPFGCRPFLFNPECAAEKLSSVIIGSTEVLPILCVRCARWERERYRERERERRKWRHLSSAEIGKEIWIFRCQNGEIGDELCTFPCQKIAPYYWRRVSQFSLLKMCTLVSPLLKGAEFTLSVPKTLRSSK